MKISAASENSDSDIDQLNQLIHSCYRSDESFKGWTTDAHMFQEGFRTTPEKLRKEMSDPNLSILKCEDESGRIIACVKAHLQGDAMYVGMLSVRPDLQAKGIGRKMMGAVDDYAKSMNCGKLIMEVVSIRTELIAWYERQGFGRNGVETPFPDEAYGIPNVEEPLILIELERSIS